MFAQTVPNARGVAAVLISFDTAVVGFDIQEERRRRDEHDITKLSHVLHHADVLQREIESGACHIYSPNDSRATQPLLRIQSQRIPGNDHVFLVILFVLAGEYEQKEKARLAQLLYQAVQLVAHTA